ncbi:MAG: type III pantothenate kinase [Pseudomonadota bacterium]
MSLKLLLDLGNTRLKWWLADGEALLRGGALVPGTEAGNFRALPLEGVTEAWVSVVGNATLLSALSDRLAWAGVDLRYIDTAREVGLVHCYEYPEQLGVDRWLAVLAARCHLPGASLVVDAGTATTLDVIDAEGRHRGGLILPGLWTMRESLHRRTAQLPEASGSRTALGENTDEAIAAGTLRAQVATIESVYREWEEQLGALCCLVTGGDGRLVYNALTIADAHHDPDWIARGMLDWVRLAKPMGER